MINPEYERQRLTASLFSDANRQNIKDKYQQAITDLTTIQTTVNPTTSQIIWAVKKEAETIQTLLVFIKNQII